jgi:RNA polymerase sigma-70 factor (ECF subfamily)
VSRRDDPLGDPTPLIRRVYSFVAFHMGPGSDAEDVTSEVFERAIRYRSSYDPRRGTPVTWLLGIAKRCIADALAAPTHLPIGERDEDSGADEQGDAVRRLDLAEALGRLGGRDQELLALRYGAGLSAREIGGIVGLEPNAVDVALHRARRRLRQELGESDEQSILGSKGLQRNRPDG